MEERLRKFAGLVEAGSFTKAAHQLHISQPALSAAIGKLERELKAELLVHGVSPLQLTSAGRFAYRAAQAISLQTRGLHAQLAELSGKKPQLTIGMIDSLAAELFADAAMVEALEDQAHLSAVVNNSPYIREAVEEHRLDMGFVVRQPSGVLRNVAAKRVGFEPLILVCHTSQLQDVQGAISRNQLPEFISYEQQSTTYKFVRQVLSDHSITLPSPTFVATSQEVMLQLVLLKKGAAVLPFRLVRDLLKQGELQAVERRRPIIVERPIDAVRHVQKKPTQPLSELMDYFENELAQLTIEAKRL